MNKPEGFESVRFGVQLPLWDYNVHRDVNFSFIEEMALLAESTGYDFVTLDDHLMRGSGSVFFESWTTLSLLVARTSRIKFQNSVLCNMYRHPALLAKMAATLDKAGGGRLELGLGAGWKQEEANAYGIPWARTGERMDRLEEAVQVMKLLWTTGEVDFEGKHFVLRGASCFPQPAQKPHPPLWIGGSGVKRTLRISAAFANGANFGNPGAAPDGACFDQFTFFENRRQVLARHCRDIGRDPSEIRLGVGVNLMLVGRDRNKVAGSVSSAAGDSTSSSNERGRASSALASAATTVEECALQVRRFVELGATDIVITRANLNGVEQFAKEVVPSLTAFKARET